MEGDGDGEGNENDDGGGEGDQDGVQVEGGAEADVEKKEVLVRLRGVDTTLRRRLLYALGTRDTESTHHEGDDDEKHPRGVHGAMDLGTGTPESFLALLSLLFVPEDEELLHQARPYLFEAVVAALGGVDHALSEATLSALANLSLMGGTTPSPDRLLVLLRLLTTCWSSRPSSTSDRLISPLLKSVHLLFHGASMGFVLSDPAAHPLLNDVLVLLTRAIQGSRDVARILTAGSALAHLVAVPGEVRTGALQRLLTMMVSRFPRVRGHAAEALYVALLGVDEEVWRGQGVPWAVGDLGRLQGVLVGTAWQGGLEGCRAARKELFAPLGLTEPTRVAKHDEKVEMVVDENASYGALLADVARGM